MRDSQQAQPGAEEPDNPENDPEILALLDFEPVPRKREVDGAWTPELQREFIARLAVTGSPGRASEEMGKTDTGVRKLYRSPEGASFRAAWEGAVELARRRKAERTAADQAVVAGSRPPSLDNRRRKRPAAGVPPAQREDRLAAPLPVVCDQCGAVGIAGDEAFSGIPDILAFEPVPVRLGPWDDEAQRAFIAALAATGSPARAAKSIGRHLIGAEKLRKGRGGRGFAEAWDAALDIARERELAGMGPKLNELASTEDETAWHADGTEYSPAEIEEVRERVIRKFLRLAERVKAEAAQSNEETNE